ncbi:MAG: hypothetical protein QOH86_1388 [Sphingomonadales bacterium]|nr:hypothetical protein [Sphingomonadales bacterium]
MQAKAAIGARRLCYFAHYHPAGLVADYVLHYLDALKRAGFAVVVASTAALGETEADKLRGACERLILRENRGLDFGSWIDCHAAVPPDGAEFLLLCNDSVYGPIGSLADCIDRLTRTPADFYGLVANEQLGRHIQSWFVLLRPAAFQSPAFRERFSSPIPDGVAKDEVILHYEVGLSRDLEAAGLGGHALYDADRHGLLARKMPFNPTHFLWEELIAEIGIPFLKVDLLRDNPLFVDDLDRWRQVVARRAPSLVPAIEADVAARRRAAGSPARPAGGAGRRLLVAYLRWFRRCAVRDYRYASDRRPLRMRLNAAWFSAGLFAYRVALKALRLMRLGSG